MNKAAEMRGDRAARSAHPPDVHQGRVAWIFGDDFDVDEIVGVENIRTFDQSLLRRVCMTPFEDGFGAAVQPGDWLVGGRNFGYGHPHDQPMLAMRLLGIAGVIAESFAPLFARGETYNGFPLISCPGVAGVVRRWDEIAVEWRRAIVTLAGSGQHLPGVPPSARQIELIEGGGGDQLLRDHWRAHSTPLPHVDHA